MHKASVAKISLLIFMNEPNIWHLRQGGGEENFTQPIASCKFTPPLLFKRRSKYSTKFLTSTKILLALPNIRYRIKKLFFSILGSN